MAQRAEARIVVPSVYGELNRRYHQYYKRCTTTTRVQFVANDSEIGKAWDKFWTQIHFQMDTMEGVCLVMFMMMLTEEGVAASAVPFPSVQQLQNCVDHRARLQPFQRYWQQMEQMHYEFLRGSIAYLFPPAQLPPGAKRRLIKLMGQKLFSTLWELISDQFMDDKLFENDIQLMAHYLTILSLQSAFVDHLAHRMATEIIVFVRMIDEELRGAKFNKIWQEKKANRLANLYEGFFEMENGEEFRYNMRLVWKLFEGIRSVLNNSRFLAIEKKLRQEWDAMEKRAQRDADGTPGDGTAPNAPIWVAKLHAKTLQKLAFENAEGADERTAILAIRFRKELRKELSESLSARHQLMNFVDLEDIKVLFEKLGIEFNENEFADDPMEEDGKESTISSREKKKKRNNRKKGGKKKKTDKSGESVLNEEGPEKPLERETVKNEEAADKPSGNEGEEVLNKESKEKSEKTTNHQRKTVERVDTVSSDLADMDKKDNSDQKKFAEKAVNYDQKTKCGTEMGQQNGKEKWAERPIDNQQNNLEIDKQIVDHLLPFLKAENLSKEKHVPTFKISDLKEDKFLAEKYLELIADPNKFDTFPDNVELILLDLSVFSNEISRRIETIERLGQNIKHIANLKTKVPKNLVKIWRKLEEKGQIGKEMAKMREFREALNNILKQILLIGSGFESDQQKQMTNDWKNEQTINGQQQNNTVIEKSDQKVTEKRSDQKNNGQSESSRPNDQRKSDQKTHRYELGSSNQANCWPSDYYKNGQNDRKINEKSDQKVEDEKMKSKSDQKTRRFELGSSNHENCCLNDHHYKNGQNDRKINEKSDLKVGDEKMKNKNDQNKLLQVPLNKNKKKNDQPNKISKNSESGSEEQPNNADQIEREKLIGIREQLHRNNFARLITGDGTARAAWHNLTDEAQFGAITVLLGRKSGGYGGKKYSNTRAQFLKYLAKMEKAHAQTELDEQLFDKYGKENKLPINSKQILGKKYVQNSQQIKFDTQTDADTNLLINVLRENGFYGIEKGRQMQIDEAIGKIRETVTKWSNGTGTLLLGGSSLLGVQTADSDIDTVCIVPEHIPLDTFFGTLQCLGGTENKRQKCGDNSLFCMLCQLVEFASVRSIVNTSVPLIRLISSLGHHFDIVFASIGHMENSNKIVMAQVEGNAETVGQLSHHLATKMAEEEEEETVKTERMARSLAGYHANLTILKMVPNTVTFRLFVLTLKMWSKKNFIYNNLLGFLHGMALYVLAAKICILYPNGTVPFLVQRFFLTYSLWEWPFPVQLGQIRPHLLAWSADKEQSTRFRMFGVGLFSSMSMPIISPGFPEQNAGFNINFYTAKIIQKAMREALAQFGSNAPLTNWEELLEQKRIFSDMYQHFFAIECAASSRDLVEEFCGFVSTRIRVQLLRSRECVWGEVNFCHARSLVGCPGHILSKYKMISPNASCMVWLVGIDFKQYSSSPPVDGPTAATAPPAEQQNLRHDIVAPIVTSFRRLVLGEHAQPQQKRRRTPLKAEAQKIQKFFEKFKNIFNDSWQLVEEVELGEHFVHLEAKGVDREELRRKWGE